MGSMTANHSLILGLPCHSFFRRDDLSTGPLRAASGYGVAPRFKSWIQAAKLLPPEGSLLDSGQHSTHAGLSCGGG